MTFSCREPRPVQRPIGLQQKIIRFIMGCVSSKGDRDGPPAVGFNSSGASSSVNRFQVGNPGEDLLAILNAYLPPTPTQTGAQKGHQSFFLLSSLSSYVSLKV